MHFEHWLVACFSKYVYVIICRIKKLIHKNLAVLPALKFQQTPLQWLCNLDVASSSPATMLWIVDSFTTPPKKIILPIITRLAQSTDYVSLLHFKMEHVNLIAITYPRVEAAKACLETVNRGKLLDSSQLGSHLRE